MNFDDTPQEAAFRAQARAFVELIKPEVLATRDYDQGGHSER